MGGPVVRGVNRRCRELVDTFVRIVKESQAQRVIQLGDFFDNPRQPASVVDFVIESLLPLGVEWHIMAGNHDISSFSAPSAVAPLRHVKNFYVHEEIEQLGSDFVLVPYTSLGVSASLAKMPVADCTLMHYGLSSHTSSFDYASLSEIEKLSEGSRTTLICGHEHHASTYAFETQHSILGSMSDLNFGDIHAGTKLHGIVEERTHGPALFYKPHHYGPSFRSIDTAYTLRLLLSRIGDEDFSLYVRTDGTLAPAIKRLTDIGLITDFVVQDAATEEKAEEAVAEAPPRIDEALYEHLRSKYPSDVADAAVRCLQEVLAKVKL